MRRNALIGVAFVGILLFFATFSYAEMQVIGEGVSFGPGRLTPGGTLSMDIRFRVAGFGPAVPIAFSVVEAGRTPDWSHPSIRTGMFDVNSHTIGFAHTIPASIPSTGVCLNVYAHFPGTAIRSTLLIMNACYGAVTRAGTGQTIPLNHDLTVKINSFSVDRRRDLDPGPGATYRGDLNFTIKNLGTAPFGPTTRCWIFSLYFPTATGPYAAGWNNTAVGTCDTIPGGGSVTVTKEVVIPDKTSMIKVAVSVERLYRETDESNNSDEKGVTLLTPSGIRPATPDVRKK